MRILNFISTILSAGILLAGDAPVPRELEDGRRLFLANCAACHGPDGDSVTGIDLFHGKLRRVSSDDEFISIIRAGIPGTSMPSNYDFSKYEAGEIVTYLRSMAVAEPLTAVRGDPVRGKALFEGAGGCMNCHRVGYGGSRTGPDLTAIGALRRAAELKDSIVDPRAEVVPQNRFVRIVTRDGATISGRLLNHDTFTVQLIDSQDRLRSLFRANLREFEIVTKSPMPSYKDKFSEAELADLVGYLASLRGVNKQ